MTATEPFGATAVEESTARERSRFRDLQIIGVAGLGDGVETTARRTPVTRLARAKPLAAGCPALL